MSKELIKKIDAMELELQELKGKHLVIESPFGNGYRVRMAKLSSGIRNFLVSPKCPECGQLVHSSPLVDVAEGGEFQDG